MHVLDWAFLEYILKSWKSEHQRETLAKAELAKNGVAYISNNIVAKMNQ